MSTVFSDSGTAEKSYLTSLRVRFEQVDDLDPLSRAPRPQGTARQSAVRGGVSPIWVHHRISSLPVYRVAENVEHTSERILADRNADTVSARRTGIPRTRSSLSESIMHRTVLPPICCATSITRVLPWTSTDRASFYVRDAAGLKLAVYNRSRDLNDPSRIHQLSPISTAPACGSFLSCEKCSCRHCPKSEIRMPSAKRRQHGNHAGCNITRLRQQNANAYFLACCASRFFLYAAVP